MSRVAILRSQIMKYEAAPPFHPPEVFPELARIGIRETDSKNEIYRAVRETLAIFGLDKENFGKQTWNPLGVYIRPGDRVVIKPNFVLHEYGAQKGANCLTTHGSVLRAILDYVYLAGGPEARFIIADAPLQAAEFERVLDQAAMRQVQEFYRRSLDCDVDIHDLRQVHAVVDEDSSLIRQVERLAGDPSGYCELDLGESSRLKELDALGPRYVVGDYDAAVTNQRHRNQRHSYLVSRTVLDADVVISVPKLKTHSKAGVTVCLKNTVGIIGSKDCLPHHRHGKPSFGGDEFPADYPISWLLSARMYTLLQGRAPQFVWRMMRGAAKSLFGAGTSINGEGASSGFFSSGGWHGNDTIWRTVDDLNRILFFVDPDKIEMKGKRQRRYFALVDGIIGMEGDGPLRGKPKPSGVMLAGEDPLAVDIVAATILGFNWRRIRMLDGIASSQCEPKYSEFAKDETALELASNCRSWQSFEELRRNNLGFQPPSGWRDFVEMRCVG